MDTTEKYFPQTTAALASLKETADLLNQNVTIATQQNQELETSFINLRQQIAAKAKQIETVIETLSNQVD